MTSLVSQKKRGSPYLPLQAFTPNFVALILMESGIARLDFEVLFCAITYGSLKMGEPDILTDEQIDELLNQAEARLRAKAEGTNSDEILLETAESAPKSRKPYAYMIIILILPRLTKFTDSQSYDMV